MKKALEYFYNSLDTELLTEDPTTYRIAKGGLIDESIEIAFIEGIRLATGAGMMDIKKAIRMCGDELNKENFNKQMKSIYKFTI